MWLVKMVPATVADGDSSVWCHSPNPIVAGVREIDTAIIRNRHGIGRTEIGGQRGTIIAGISHIAGTSDCPDRTVYRDLANPVTLASLPFRNIERSPGVNRDPPWSEKCRGCCWHALAYIGATTRNSFHDTLRSYTPYSIIVCIR